MFLSARKITKMAAAFCFAALFLCLSPVSAPAAAPETSETDGPVDEAALEEYRFESMEAYVNMIRPIARKVGLKYNYLPSVLAAQCIQETGYGGYTSTGTASMIYYHNHLGMKTSMINSTWAKHSVWPGQSYLKRTPEWYGGRLTHITDSFRIYKSAEQCLTDYVAFMTYARLPGGAYKYRYDVIGNPSYAKTIEAVRANGYCTDPNYSKAVIRLINKWNLTALDKGFGIRVSRVKLNRKKLLKLKKGASYQLKATTYPRSAPIRSIRWKSSDMSVASVSSKGKVRALKKGTVTITATSRDNKKAFAEVRIRVK